MLEGLRQQDGEIYFYTLFFPGIDQEEHQVRTKLVENLAAGKKQDLTDQGTFALNQIDKTLKLENVHLSRLADGYVLDVLGKNGEVKPDRAVIVQLKHRDFKGAHSVSLKSDQSGRVRLGTLADIQWINVTNSDGTA